MSSTASNSTSSPQQLVRKKFFYGYVVAAAGFGVWLVGWGSYGTFSTFFLPVSTEFGWTRAETALAFSLSSIVMGFLAIVMGWLTDRLGPRLVLTVFGSFVGIACLLMATMNSLWQYNIYYGLVMAIGASTLTVPTMATIARWFVKRRGLVSAIVQCGVSMGGFVYPPATVWLITNVGWRAAYFWLGATAFLSIIIFGLLLRKDPKEMGQYPDNASAPTVTSGKPAVRGPSLTLRQAIPTQQFWILAGLFFVFGFCRSTFMAHLVPHVQDLGHTLADGANVYAFLTICGLIGRLVMGPFADKFGNRAALIIAYAATVIDMVIGLYAQSLFALYVYAFIFGFSWGAQAVLRFTASAEAFGTKAAGMTMGVLGIFENVLAGGLGIWFAGVIFDYYGTYTAVYWLGLGISIIGVVFAWLLKPIKQKPS